MALWRRILPTGVFSCSKVIAAAKIAEAHDFIMQLPKAMKRLWEARSEIIWWATAAVAITVLKNPPILILDEATSAVDNETEAAIQRSLERITIDRTTIAIAHRLSTVRNADRIYVMEQGKLVEWGRHEQLLEQQGVYASLWRVQSGLRCGYITTYLLEAIASATLGRGEEEESEAILAESVADGRSGRCIPRNY